MSLDFHSLYSAPFGTIQCNFRHNALQEVRFIPEISPHSEMRTLPPQWQEAFDAYFSGSLKDFALTPSECGTPFQRRVWAAIAAIPYGHTATYQDIARTVGSAARAVGNACGRNPLAIVIPCHRIVASNGGLGGFSQGRDPKLLLIKRWLLQHENPAWTNR